jgi:hypothetical protein
MDDADFLKLLGWEAPLSLLMPRKKHYVLVTAILLILMANGVYMALQPALLVQR